VLIYALQVYKDGLWTPHPLYGKDWRVWIKHSIGKVVTPNEQSIITNGVPVLEYLRRNPIRVKDTVINHMTFLRSAKATLFEATLPVVATVDLNSAKDQASFRRLMIAATTMIRDDFRAFLNNEFGRNGRAGWIASSQVRYKGSSVIVTLTCPREDAPRLFKKLRGVADLELPEEA
jgi:hypothetical protein